MGINLVDDNDASGDTGAEKDVGRQTDDAHDVTLADKVFPYGRLGIAAKQNPMRQDTCAPAGALE